VTADERHLHDALAGLLERQPDAAELARARDLFTRAIETPGGLKVQTIHAFCERLLQRFPLEAGVPPGFSILDEDLRATLVKQATEAVLVRATADPRGRLGKALSTAIRFAVDDNFDAVLAQALMKRDWLEDASRIDLGNADGIEAIKTVYRRALGLAAADDTRTIEAGLASVLTEAQMTRARDVLLAGSKTDAERAADLAAALAATTAPARIAALAGLFLTKDRSPRARLMTAKPKSAEPEIADALERAQAVFHDLTLKQGRLAVADATLAVIDLAGAVMQRYHALKAQRAALDFDDLIRATGNLLRFGDDAQWVLYKLDGGLDHILVDEAQDTSPTQWRVIEALAREFFAGAGSRDATAEGPRTAFAVGDEKQSIYGFQGAAPKMFADMGQRFATLAREAGLAFERVPLTLSFRTVAPILETVDRVFADPEHGAGLTSTGEIPRHIANRFGMGGLVEIWETEVPEETTPSPAWQPLDDVAPGDPASRLAARIADRIADWIATGERLASEDRAVTYGDILILVRRRRPFADLMVSALKKRAIPVAGADRLLLTDQLAVMDIMALAEVLLLPEDDLALAAVLKSPLFGLDDDDLLRLAPGRRGSLWSALLAAGASEPRYAAVAERMKRWRSRADVIPPYEFLTEVLVHDGMRKQLLARLGTEAADPIDELITLALTYDDQAPPSLQGFMHWLRASDREIKRDMEHGRNEVRVMTVHGSKGLEAPIVFLPDTCTAPNGGRPGALLAFDGLDLPVGIESEPFLWPVKGSSAVPEIREAREIIRAREAEEHNRLLYVALTRPRDRLYVAGFEGGNGREKGCWYDKIERSFAGIATREADAGGRPLRRIERAQTADPVAGRAEAHQIVTPEEPPAWARAMPAKEPGLAIPIAPSRLAPLDTDDEGDPLERLPPPDVPEEPAAPSPATLSDGNRFLRGTLTHALLQHLPEIEPSSREAAARAFVAARASGLSDGTRASIVTETLAVLDDPAFAAVFGPGSRAEVPVVAELAPPGGTGQKIRLAGQLDRIVVSDHEVLIIDFKTNRPPPVEIERVPEAYVLQLAAYRLALARIFPARDIRAALLWTDGPRLMEIPAQRLDEAANRLFVLGRASLDA
jgi:ATP-dependent helicase/nuclease subunit A